MSEYKFAHPKIFWDFMSVYKKYYAQHKHLPKIFRVTVWEYIMAELAESMRLVIIANIKKTWEDYTDSYLLLKDLRARIEVLRAYFLISWEMKFVSHSFFADINDRISEISQQATGWHDWFEKNSKKLYRVQAVNLQTSWNK